MTSASGSITATTNDSWFCLFFWGGGAISDPNFCATILDFVVVAVLWKLFLVALQAICQMFQASRVFICERQIWVHMTPAVSDTGLKLSGRMSEATAHSDASPSRLRLPPTVVPLTPALAGGGDQTNGHQTGPVSTLLSTAHCLW